MGTTADKRTMSSVLGIIFHLGFLDTGDSGWIDLGLQAKAVNKPIYYSDLGEISYFSGIKPAF